MGVTMNTGIEKWHELDGDNTLALDWPLTEGSHVWEIGGFEGRWAQQIWDKFHCNITVFEPQLWAVDRMRKRFAGMDKIDIRPHGLWLEDTFLLLGNFNTDGASLVHDDGRETRQYGAFKYFYNEIVDFQHQVDVALMNIEGAEYTLLPEMISSGLISRFDYFWCQFHPESENDNRHMGLFLSMLETHDMLWNCYPTAVAWKRRE